MEKIINKFLAFIMLFLWIYLIMLFLDKDLVSKIENLIWIWWTNEKIFDFKENIDKISTNKANITNSLETINKTRENVEQKKRQIKSEIKNALGN